MIFTSIKTNKQQWYCFRKMNSRFPKSRCYVAGLEWMQKELDTTLPAK